MHSMQHTSLLTFILGRAVVSVSVPVGFVEDEVSLREVTVAVILFSPLYNSTIAPHSPSFRSFCYRKDKRSTTGKLKSFLGNREALCRKVLYLLLWSAKGWAYSELFYARYVKQSRNRPRCGPEGSRRFRPPDFDDIQHMKVVRSSGSRTGRIYPQEIALVLIFTTF
jgi:hypothetical protein